MAKIKVDLNVKSYSGSSSDNVVRSKSGHRRTHKQTKTHTAYRG